MSNPVVDVIVPVYRPDDKFLQIIKTIRATDLAGSQDHFDEYGKEVLG